LFTPAGTEPPRIPVPPNNDVFNQVASLGQELALLEKHFADDELIIDEKYQQYLSAFPADFNLKAFELDSDAETVALVDGDKQFVIKPVPKEIIGFFVGGYQVLQQWLKMHTQTYTRTTFPESHLKRLLHLFGSMERQIDIINRLDVAIRPLLAPLDSSE